MASLFTYLKQSQRFLKEQRQDLISPESLIEYVNRGRREVAGATQCIRRLTPISGSVMTASVVNGGHGYSNTPTVSITPPDFPSGQLPKPLGDQATAVAFVQNGTITAANITYGGYGYFSPQATITDSTGSGASISLQISPINQLNPGQESYKFSDINVSMFPGVDSVYMIKSVSVIYANYRYSLPMYDFSTYQAKIRQYPFQYQYVPTMASQFGQGSDGSFYAYPLPSQIYQWEFDCFCLPQDLIDDQSVDLIPQPWVDVVPYFAAHLGYLELQNLNAAEYYLQKFDQFVGRRSRYARPGRVTNIYGRFVWAIAIPFLYHLMQTTMY